MLLKFARLLATGEDALPAGAPALGYFSTASTDGMVIFLNGPPELPAMATAIGTVDPGSPLAVRYRRWAALAAEAAA